MFVMLKIASILFSNPDFVTEGLYYKHIIVLAVQEC